MVTSDGSYITPRVRKDEEALWYTCLAHTIEPSQLAAVCTALNEVGRRGVHIIWAEFEEFMYVGVFSVFHSLDRNDDVLYPDRNRQGLRFWTQLNTG